MSTADSTAIVAVVIAVIAFFVTTAQLLQALFGTADGYRRCQSSVIGDWASKTRRKFRWSEFRFETIFSTPDIRIQRSTEQENVGTLIMGDIKSRHATMVRMTDPTDHQQGDLVSWLLLLHRLHDFQRSYSLHVSKTPRQRDIPNYHTYPSTWRGVMPYVEITVRTRSWDFMPQDIVRPFASTTVGDIIAIAHRLGMQWKDLRLGESVMRAEGNGQSISSTTVRSFGILLHYTNERPPEDELYPHESLMVCSSDADKFGFGIIPGFRSLGMSDFRMDDATETGAITNAMRILEIEDYSKYLNDEKNLRSFFDLIPLVAPWIPLPQSTIVQIRRPFRKFRGETIWWGGFPAFHNRLDEIFYSKKFEAERSGQMRWVLEKYKTMHTTYPSSKAPSWEDETPNNTVLNGRDLYFLDDLFSIWRKCTEFLQGIQSQPGNLSFYRDLVSAHIALAVTCPALAEDNLRGGGGRHPVRNIRARFVVEVMHQYIDNTSKIADFMEQRGFGNRDVVRDAWWTMMLRALCWHRSVAFVDQDPSSVPVPSGLYYSKTPVYIA